MHLFRSITATAAALVVGLSAAPALAQANYDLLTARIAYEKGKFSGIRAQTTEEYLMCAAYWGAVATAAKKGYISEAELDELGPAFTNGLPETRSQLFIARGRSAKNAEDVYTGFHNTASELYVAFIKGEQKGTKRLFETLGTCRGKDS
ncbi:MAG: hypothetical protein AAFX04_01055 [Pseudomonadota bacterium]